MTEHNITENLEALELRLRKEFFRYRNGIIAEALIKQGNPFPMIYGLMLPQIAEISLKFPANLDFSKFLWEKKESREARLLAIYLIPAETVKKSFIIEMINGIITKEEAEIISFKLLKRLPYAKQLYTELQKAEENKSEIIEYALYMFGKNLSLH